MTGDGIGTLDTAFWSFSCAVYARPAIAKTCLDLQDRCGADVNVVLYALYAAKARRVLSVADFVLLDDDCRPWREGFVKALRTTRRTLKLLPSEAGGWLPTDLRGRVARLELDAERLQQERMQRIGAPLGIQAPDGLAATPLASENLAACATACAAAAFDEEAIATLARAL